MNLHGIARRAVSAINPMVTITITASDGYTTAADGKRTPKYKAAVTRDAQIQPLQAGDIAKLDGLNIQGEKRKVYIEGRLDGLVRPDQKGGDLITFPDGTVWAVAMVLEAWPDWSCVAVTRQM